jgi:hypothetical protein
LAVVGDMWEGMDNVPRMLGSAVRERGKVDSFTSGMAEGGKGLGFGLWDGVAGLVTEPIHGAKQEVSVGDSDMNSTVDDLYSTSTSIVADVGFLRASKAQ